MPLSRSIIIRSCATFALSGLLWPATARAAEEEVHDEEDMTAACVSSFDEAQALRRDGKLIATREELLACAQPHCPDVVETKCSAWLAEVEDAVPSLVFVVPTGLEPDGVVVSIDGEVEKNALAGRPIDLDPGSHTIGYRRGAEPAHEQTVVLAAGEQRKQIVLELALPEGPKQPEGEPESDSGPEAPPVPPPDEGPPVPPPNSEISPLVWVGFGIAGAGAIAGAITGALALSKASELETSCPNQICTDAQQGTFDSGNALAHGSTASFAIAGAGAIVGVIGIVLSGGEPREAALVPLAGPGTFGLRGRF